MRLPTRAPPVLLVLGLVLTAALTACAPDPSPVPTETPGQLYGRFCALCHGADGLAETDTGAPALANAEFQRAATDAFLYESISRGRPGTTMTAFHEEHGGPLSETEIQALVRYIREWRVDSGSSARVPPVDLPPGEAARGGSIYAAECAECHGDDGRSLLAPDLANQVFQELADDSFIANAVLAGRGERMPPIDLSASELADVIAFIRQIEPAEASADQQ